MGSHSGSGTSGALPPVGERDAASDESLHADLARPEDLEPLARLQLHLWSPDLGLNLARMRWKYGEPDRSLIAVVRQAGRPVAMRGFSRQTWEADGRVHQVFASDDLVVEPALRGRGLFHRISAFAYPQLAKRGAAWILSTSALAATRRLLLQSGRAVDIGPLHPIGRMHKAAQWSDRAAAAVGRLPVLWRWAGRLPYGGRSAQASFAALDDAATPSGLSISDAARPEAMASLVARLPWDGRLRKVRDRPYFEDRYADPLHEYRFVFARTGERMTGYLVIERSRSDYANPRRVHIADWEAEDPTLAEALLSTVLSAGAFAELVTWKESLSADLGAIALRHGFREVDRGLVAQGLPTVLLTSIGSMPAAELALAGRRLACAPNWDLRLAYTSYV
jgi:GNAT superfamily N-acetyltransferase